MNFSRTLNESSNLKIIIFGAGEITNLLIKDLTLNGQKVLCVTDNSFGQLNGIVHNNLETVTYKDVINSKLEFNIAIFTWRDLGRLNQDNKALLGWLKSEKFQVSKSFFLSSASVYKHSAKLHSEESEVIDGNVKVMLEKSLKDLSIKKKILHTDLRISNVYGVGISHGFIGSLLDSIKTGSKIQLFQNLHTTRDYIYVEDVVYAIKMLLKIDNHQNCINISTGIGITLSELLEYFSYEGFNFENRQYLFDNLKVREVSILDCSILASLINWQPRKLSSVLKKMLGTI